jgi:Zn-dependent peptidase ImmA (M78 family)
LAEELAHICLGHPPSLQIHNASGYYTLNYNRLHEAQAYWVGTAALAPRQQLERARKLRHTIQTFARFCGVSPDLIRFRCEKTEIWLPEDTIRENVQHQTQQFNVLTR